MHTSTNINVRGGNIWLLQKYHLLFPFINTCVSIDQKNSLSFKTTIYMLLFHKTLACFFFNPTGNLLLSPLLLFIKKQTKKFLWSKYNLSFRKENQSIWFAETNDINDDTLHNQETKWAQESFKEYALKREVSNFSSLVFAIKWKFQKEIL